MECQDKTPRCVNCHDYFQQLRPLIKNTIISKHFQRDLPDFNSNLLIDCEHQYFKKLHKFEEVLNGNHIFRALLDKIHIVYAIDKDHNLLLLRAFHNFKEYKKFIDNKKQILHMIDKIEQ